MVLNQYLYTRTVGIPMGANWASLTCTFFSEREFMASFSGDKEAETIQSFNSTSRYLDNLLNIDNPYFEGTVGRIYPFERQSNKSCASKPEAPFSDLYIYLKRICIIQNYY